MTTGVSSSAPAQNSIRDDNGGTSIVLFYPGWAEDYNLAEQYFALNSNGSLFQKKIDAMKNKQRLHEGDRSHPDIVALDATDLNYPGWEDDKDEALKIHTGDCSALYLGGFPDKLRALQRKQMLHTDRSAFPELGDLDSKAFTYPDSKTDVAIAERQFVENPNSQLFQKKVQAMMIKESIFLGDRSHPSVVALDSIFNELTYKGNELDVEEAMQRLTGDCSLLYLGEFEDKLKEMRRKQRAHMDRTKVEELQYLESLEFTYDGYIVDKKCAERLFLEYDSSSGQVESSLFHKKVAGMKVKQQLHEGDRSSHPEIRALDAAVLSYPGAASDRQMAEDRITGDCSISRLGEFQQFFSEMKNKQEMHINRSGLQALQTLDALLPSQIAITAEPEEFVGMIQEADTKKSEPIETDGTSLSTCTDDEVVEEEERQKKCVVCFEREASHAYIPCGHLCVCSGCADLMDSSQNENEKQEAKRCPLCRQPSVCVTRIFM